MRDGGDYLLLNMCCYLLSVISLESTFLVAKDIFEYYVDNLSLHKENKVSNLTLLQPS
jgi:hypothetical protein